MKTLYSWHQRIVVVSSCLCKTLSVEAAQAFPMPLYTLFSTLPCEGGSLDHQEILVEVQDHIAIVTLNRPQKLNAYTTLMGDDLTHVYESLNKRREKNYNG